MNRRRGYDPEDHAAREGVPVGDAARAAAPSVEQERREALSDDRAWHSGYVAGRAAASPEPTPGLREAEPLPCGFVFAMTGGRCNEHPTALVHQPGWHGATAERPVHAYVHEERRRGNFDRRRWTGQQRRRADLDASPAPEPTGLDAERLARAHHAAKTPGRDFGCGWVFDSVAPDGMSLCPCRGEAENIAAEYARLTGEAERG